MDRNRNFNQASNVNCCMNKRIGLLANFLPQKFVGLPLLVTASCCALLLPVHSSLAQANDTGIPTASLQASNLVNPQPFDGTGNSQSSNYDSRHQIDELYRAIEDIEVEQGPWGSGLSEQLAGLGKTFQLRGEHDEAIEVFERAIHVNRINQGLYDLSQVSIIEDMLDSLLVKGRWKEVHERQEYLYWIHQRNYGNNDPRMLPVIDKLGSWYVNDYALNPSRRQVGHLVDAYNLFEDATSIIENQYGDSDLRMIMPLRGLVLSNWFLWTYASQNPSSIVSNDRFTGEISTSNSLSGNPNRIAPYVRNNYANGKDALTRMVEIYDKNPNSPPGAAAAAKVELADWHMLSRRWRSATELYQEAYKSLSSDDVTKDQAVKIFERPVALPDLVLMESDVEQYSRRSSSSASPPASSYVLVSFDVSRFGEARNIDILESQPEGNVGIRARVKRSLSDTRFRPRMVDGEAVDSKGLVHKYVFNEK